MSAKLDDVERLLDRFRGYIYRLNVLVKPDMDRKMKELAVKHLSRFLLAFAEVTKILSRSRASSCFGLIPEVIGSHV